MNQRLDEQPLKRPSFFDGQRLTAADLSSAVRTERELRWLHNRGLHNWGIVYGYELTGNIDDRVVRIAPGYALDCRGRDLLLFETMEIAIPPVPGPATYYLVASYANEEELEPVLRRGVCATSGSVRRLEQPLMHWRDPLGNDEEDALRPGLDVVLGGVSVVNCRLAETVSGTERRNAKPEVQPYIAAGTTKSGATDWQLWPENEPIGVTTTVSTKAANFRTTPQYHVHVLGKRTTGQPIEVSGEGVQWCQLFFDGFPHVADPTPTGFTLRVIMPLGWSILPEGQKVFLNRLHPDDSVQGFENRFKSLGWHVSWLGIEG